MGTNPTRHSSTWGIYLNTTLSLQAFYAKRAPWDLFRGLQPSYLASYDMFTNKCVNKKKLNKKKVLPEGRARMNPLIQDPDRLLGYTSGELFDLAMHNTVHDGPHLGQVAAAVQEYRSDERLEYVA